MIVSVVILMVFAEWFVWRMFHLADGVCLQLAYSARRFVLSVVVFVFFAWKDTFWCFF